VTSDEKTEYKRENRNNGIVVKAEEGDWILDT
jgi:hypothetical protein